MNPWKKESLNLQVGDWIIRQDEEIKMEGGSTFVSPGMKGKVISLHDGFHLNLIQGGSIPPRVAVQFENGMRLLADQRMKWEKITR